VVKDFTPDPEIIVIYFGSVSQPHIVSAMIVYEPYKKEVRKTDRLEVPRIISRNLRAEHEIEHCLKHRVENLPCLTGAGIDATIISR
jgi:hypothetical protein